MVRARGGFATGRLLRSLGVAGRSVADIQSTSRQGMWEITGRKRSEATDLATYAKKMSKKPTGTTLLNGPKCVFYKQERA